MPRGSITLSPSHGVNPSLSLCFFCGQEDGTIVLPGRLPGDAEAPRRGVWHHEPCATCRDYMKQGVILLQVRDGESGDNPYRTGRMVVLKDDAIRRLITPDSLRDDILRRRMAFIDESTWRALGLPEGES